MSLSIDVAELVGLVCEGVLYGIFVILCGLSTYLLVQRRRSGEKINFPMMIASGLMILLATGQLVADAQNVMVAFINKDRAGRIAFMNNASESLFAWKHAIFICMTIVSDWFATYRCYVVWGRKLWVVALPIGLSLSSAACGFKATWTVRHLEHASIKAQAHLVAALFSLSLAANAVATSMLAFRIWRVDRQTRQALEKHPSSLLPVVRIIAESGILNAAFLFAYTMTLVSGSQGLETMAEIVTPFIGIIFTVVIIRVGLNADREKRLTAYTGSIRFSFRNTDRSLVSESTTTQQAMPSVAISVGRPTDRLGNDSESGADEDRAVGKDQKELCV